MKKPNLFIVGEAKSGTTALLHFLNQHPDVYMSDLEVNVFGKDIIKENLRFHKNRFWRRYVVRKTKQYMRLMFRKAKNEKIIGEATTNNAYSKLAAKEIKKFNPDAKIIFMLREPVSFLYSLHSQFIFNLEENERDFETALDLEENRKKGNDVPSGVTFPSNLYYSDRIKFADHLKRYMDVFNKKNIMVILLDDFKKDNPGTYKKVLNFLDLKDYKPEFKVVNPNKELRSIGLKYVVDSLRLLPLAKMLCPKSWDTKISEIYYKTVCTNVNRPKLDPELKKKLMKRYKPEVIKLSKLLKRDLLKLWKYDRI